MIEYKPWYTPGAAIVRCTGVDGCGAMMLAEDQEKHEAWHDAMAQVFQCC